MTKWGKILDRLIKESGISKNSLHEKGIINRNTLNTTIRSSHSPNVASLDKYLKAFSLTWHDWAKACEKMEKAKVTGDEVASMKAALPHPTKRQAKVHPFPAQPRKAFTLEEEETEEAEKKPYYDAKLEIPYDIMADIEKFLMTKPTQKEIDRFYREYLLKRFLPTADAVRKQFEAALKKGEAKKRKARRTRGTA